MKDQIQAHINEIIAYLGVIESGLFPGNKSHTVIELKKYFNSVLYQLMEAKQKLEEEESHES